MIREEAIESFKCSNEQAKLRLEVEKMRMDSGEIKELEFYIERDEMAIKALEQEPKTGHWIVDGSVDCYLDKVRCHCSECGKKKELPADYDHIKQELSISYKYSEFIDNFCPNCGTKMVEPQERSEE